MDDSTARTFPHPPSEIWPELPLDAWEETYYYLHHSSQIVGKIRLGLAPQLNHWWHIALYVTPRGLTTSSIPYHERAFQMTFDFIDDQLLIETDDGARNTVRLQSASVAEFYTRVLTALQGLGIAVEIWPVPVEVDERTPFNEDRRGRYDPESARRFQQVLIQVDRVFKKFRGRFEGKASPVHFFWGSFDLATTRFSGRPAPAHPGAPNVGRHVMVEAYSREVSSCGFWPGAGIGAPSFYSYAYPEPKGFAQHPIRPQDAYYHDGLKEFVLPYDVVRSADSPDDMLLDFLQSTYEAAANLGKWNRDELEVPEAFIGETQAGRVTPSVGGPSRPV